MLQLLQIKQLYIRTVSNIVNQMTSFCNIITFHWPKETVTISLRRSPNLSNNGSGDNKQCIESQQRPYKTTKRPGILNAFSADDIHLYPWNTTKIAKGLTWLPSGRGRSWTWPWCSRCLRGSSWARDDPRVSLPARRSSTIPTKQQTGLNES